MIYYNDNDTYCCRVLRARIADGRLPAGTVDDRSISDVPADELNQYKQIHLFAGIGGFPLALKWANFGRDRSIITAGFPCQDLSVAGKGSGLEGKRSGLFWETVAAIGMVRPDIFILENVSALLTRGVGTILGSLASLGYRVEWHCVPAAYVGAPHRRDRIWIVGVRDVADTEVGILTGINGREGSLIRSEGCSEDVADTIDSGLQGGIPRGQDSQRQDQQGYAGCDRAAHGQPGQNGWSTECRLGIHPDGLRLGLDECGGWECGVPRVAKGQKDRAKRLKALGNAIVPQCAAFIVKYIC